MTPRTPRTERSALFNSILKAFDKHKAWLAGTGATGVDICKGTLFQVIESYYLDLERLKSAHNITLEDEHKKAAFMLKWLVKLRPVQYPATLTKIGKPRALANETFALLCAFAFLGIRPENVPDPLLDNLIYFLHYRYADDERGLALMMYLMQQLVLRRAQIANLEKALGDANLRIMALETGAAGG